MNASLLCRFKKKSPLVTKKHHNFTKSNHYLFKTNNLDLTETVLLPFSVLSNSNLMSEHLSSQQTGDPVCHIWNKTLQIHSLNLWVSFSICSVNVYLSLWETPSDWECLEHSGVLTTVKWSLWGFDVCLSCLVSSLCLIQTYSAHLTLYGVL